MGDSSQHAAFRKRALMEIYHHTGANMQRQISCAELAEKLGLTPEDAILIAHQIEAKKWITFDRMTHQMLMTIDGIEEAEKMERSTFQRFYEDHVVLWSLVLLILGVVLSTASAVVVNLTKPAMPAPVINVIVPDHKEDQKK